MLTTHATERATSRMADAGIDPEPILATAERIATAYARTSIAVRLTTLPEHHGDTDRPRDERESNGNEVWAVCRGGHVTTIMLRRDTQPRTTEAFGVRYVARLEVKFP
jgi:hypothetical protein